MIGPYRLVTGLVLMVGSSWYRLRRRKRAADISWVVGVEEIASVVRQLADAIPDSYSVSFVPHAFYAHEYDYHWKGPGRPGIWERVVCRPLLLARLASRSRGVVYVGRRGFLGSSSREVEFAFLRRRGLKICCYFTGSDIRAPRLLEQLERETGVPNLASRLRIVRPELLSEEYDRIVRRVAEEADRFADVIFTASADQASYITRPTEPFLYFLPDDAFVAAERRPGSPPVVLHAPSSPTIKGTELVRRAVAELEAEGHSFEYVELSGVPHDRVREALKRADIVVNQLFALMPGVFGVEALAAGCAVLMSADARIETDLPPDSNSAWLVTREFDLAENLSRLIGSPDVVRELGRVGRKWALQNASMRSSSARLNAILDRVLAESE